MSSSQSPSLADQLPSADQPDLFERPLADASEGGVTEPAAPVRADGWRNPALPPAYRYGDRAGYPQPHYQASRSGAYGPYGANRPGYPKVYS
ncbi:hypothetical protein [Asticcacaulis sp. AC460]|uniref:hypothetical protein n=1 Tax=Asticcacaulis sp. AC460 TaxID=1282360 RepID=UPI0012DE155B|nr:hypothetical protein [Asticcacaulis sp. AC460]